MSAKIKPENGTIEPRWAELLKSAVEEPGIISAAYSAFHSYSVGNQMAAAWQCARRGIQLGPLATYRGWREKGRQVSKGARAIVLCMPVTCKGKRTDSETGEETEYTFSRFAWKANWFSVWQTEGADFEVPSVSPDWDTERALAALEIELIPYAMPDGNCQGYATGRQVAINPVATLPHKTLLHELAHVVLGHTAELMADGDRTPRDIREAEAEGVAFILGHILGTEGAAESRGYIQHWLKGGEITEKSAQRIYTAANKILTAGKAA